MKNYLGSWLNKRVSFPGFSNRESKCFHHNDEKVISGEEAVFLRAPVSQYFSLTGYKEIS